jgi:hypothetical protein
MDPGDWQQIQFEFQNIWADKSEVIDFVHNHKTILQALKTYVMKIPWCLNTHFKEYTNKTMLTIAKETGLSYSSARVWFQKCKWSEDKHTSITEMASCQDDYDLECMSIQDWMTYKNTTTAGEKKQEVVVDPADPADGKNTDNGGEDSDAMTPLKLFKQTLKTRSKWAEAMTDEALAYLLFCAMHDKPTLYSHVSGIGDTIPLMLATWLQVPIMLVNKEYKKASIDSFTLVKPGEILGQDGNVILDSKQPPSHISDSLLFRVKGLVRDHLTPAFPSSQGTCMQFWSVATTMRIQCPTEHILAVAPINASQRAGQIIRRFRMQVGETPVTPTKVTGLD